MPKSPPAEDRVKNRMNSDMNKRDLKKQTKAQKQIANEFENSILSPPKQEESLPRKSINTYDPPEQLLDRRKKQRPQKPTRKPPPPPIPFDFDYDILQTEN